MADLITMTGVNKKYKNGVTAIYDLDLKIKKGEFVFIIGGSGSGKSTLIKMLYREEKPTKGQISIGGIDVTKLRNSKVYKLRRRLGVVFQDYKLLPKLTVYENVAFALEVLGEKSNDIRIKTLKALELVSLKGKIKNYPDQLSGGEQQRVAIARAIVNNPDIILADEPTGALDSDTSVQIMKILKKISKEKLVIMVTHNPELAKEYSTRIINIKDGKIVDDSNPYNDNYDKLEENEKEKSKKTKMTFLTALSLSFNNLMTKKGRTILVAIAGSIGIIGIALVLAVSTGFQNYVDSIGEETLTSYPLNIMQESMDITSSLLSMRSGKNKSDGSNKVVEQQYITSMLSNVSTNDLKSFKKHIEKNNKKIQNDVSNIKYSYSIDPNIYTIDAKKKLARLNPNN